MKWNGAEPSHVWPFIIFVCVYISMPLQDKTEDTSKCYTQL